MTHSHDTATPALSVESEYVLVPRDRAHRHAVELEQCSIFAADVGEAIAKSMTDAAADLRLALAAAPAPNPSSAAKGGEAVVVPYDDFHAAYGFVPRSKVSPDRCLKTRLRALLRTEDLAHADEAEALASPSPQPANAVREATAPHADWLKNSLQQCADSLSARPLGLRGPFTLRTALASDPAPAGEAVEPVATNFEAICRGYELMHRALCSIAGTSGASPTWYAAKAHEASKRITALADVKPDSNAALPGDCLTQTARVLAAHPAPEDTARLREDLERVTRERDEAENELGIALDRKKAFQETVDRIWKALGSPSYETLGGRSISELVADYVARAETAEVQRDDARKALVTAWETLIKIANDNLSGEQAMVVANLYLMTHLPARSASREDESNG